MIINLKGEVMKKTGMKGDITFYETKKGDKYQQIGSDTPFRVRNGSVTYKYITKANGCEIKYNNNGIYGFAVFKNRKCVKNQIWDYEKALAASAKL